ncbi:TPA: malto-oligosyltrehalose synthase, partial [Pluralibacter gergoviae]|nr:malto-oligosyltrehalose synthase [Pluralibacter gergoviae]
DTKRGEDARARLYALTEAPSLWAENLARWRQMNQTQVRFLNDGTAPNGADTWMLYQALAGVWPAAMAPDDAAALKTLEARFTGFVEKALREAKQRTDWIDSNEVYENTVLDYARHLLSPDNAAFLQDFSDGLQPFIRAGLLNGLTQTVIKLTAPGVPDIYQGSEGLNFSLVDPDNRREPDFAALASDLAAGSPALFHDERAWRDGRLKQFVTAGLLRLRPRFSGLLRHGDWLPLKAEDDDEGRVIAYARTGGEGVIIVVAPRLALSAVAGGLPAGEALWGSARVSVPPALAAMRFRELFSNESRILGETLTLAQEAGRVLVFISA